ncbi:hypothetical protein ABZQ91_12415 [Pseudomonas aeruginosa]
MGSISVAQPGRRSRPHTHRVNRGGNYCGHSPEHPRLELLKDVVSPGKALPGILTELKERVKRYYGKPAVLPSLRNATPSLGGRQQRSERREACLLMLAVIVSYTDLVSLRCGVPTKQGFMSLTLDYLVEYTGLHMRRAERAMADLKRANLITCSQPRKLNEDGTYRGLASVKAVNKMLFTAFGLGKRLERETERAKDRLAKKIKKAGGTMTSWARNRLVIGSISAPKPLKTSAGDYHKPTVAESTTGLAAAFRSPQIPQRIPAGADAQTYALARTELAIAILKANPGKTAAEVNAEADQILRQRYTAKTAKAGRFTA